MATDFKLAAAIPSSRVADAKPLRWMVAQEGSRRNYAIPLAFQRLGLLRLFYADIWCRQGRSLLKQGPPATRSLANRFNPAIPTDQVVSFNPSAIAHKAAQHHRKRTGSREVLGHCYCDYGEWFGSRVERHLRSVELLPDQDFFFGFNTNCLEAIQMLRRRGVASIVTQVDPGRTEEDLCLAEAERWPDWERREGRLPQRYWDRLKAEWEAADLVGVNSDWTRQALVQQGVPGEKIFVVPLAIDLKTAGVGVDRGGLPGLPLRVLWLGTLTLRKGIQYLAGAARLLQDTNMEFLVAGEIAITRRALESLPGNMKILGRLNRDQTAAAYAAADVFVLPTLSDGFAITQLEAMAEGLPVVTTPNCGRVVTDGVDGFIIPPSNSEALAEVLARLHHDRSLLRDMSRQARLTVRRFDLPSNALAIVNAVATHRQRLASHTIDSADGGLACGRISKHLPAAPLPSPGRVIKISRLDRESETLPKAVVCFSGSRDHYQVALALQEAGLLEKLVTDLYWEPDRTPWGDRLTRHFPKLAVRHRRGLPQSQVITPAGVMVDSLFMKTALASRSRQIRLDRAIGRRARRESWKTQTALFSYSYYAAEAFAEGTQRPPLRFLFQLHPHPATVRKILQEELRRAPRFAASLKWEHELGASDKHFAALCQESSRANGWVVASSYTASTLAENGVPRDQIQVVPYGVDFEEYPCRTSAPPSTAPFRIIWVGSMTQRKGLSYFLEAVRALRQENLEVLICGHHAVDQQVIREYGIKSVRVLKGLATADLTAELRAADLFVLPSLAEGFGHVILEAMASGLPVLTTASTCAPDVLTPGEHGFIVPIRDSGALVEAISWGRQHRSRLYHMGLAAAHQARRFTWERFRKGIVSAYGTMVRQRLADSDQQVD